MCSIYEPQRIFRIEKGAEPERIFREKGSNRWWTKNELQLPGAPENPTTSPRLNGKDQMRGTHPKCAKGVPKAMGSKAQTAPGLPKRRCEECKAVFQPARPWQRFHSETCRRAHWKRSGQRIGLQSQDSRVRAGVGFEEAPVMASSVPA